MFTSSRKLRRAHDAYRAAAAQVHQRDAVIRELETNLEVAEARAFTLARGRGDVDHVIQLEQQVKTLTETVTQLRRGVVDDKQTTELRRQLSLAQRTIRDLHDRLATLQAANSGIPQLRVIA